MGREMGPEPLAGRCPRKRPLDQRTYRETIMPPLMQSILAYANGQWMESERLAIGVEDQGFLLGATVSERLRTFGGRVFRRDAHLARLRRSLQILGLDADRIGDEVAAAVDQFVVRNRGRIDPADDWSIVAFATPGTAAGSRPTVCVHGWPLRFEQWVAMYERGLHVVVSDVRQVPNNCWPADLKCRSRMHYYLADMQAAAAEPGSRALLLDQQGYLAEATTANVIVHRQGEGLVSPPSDHVLVGISLGVAQELAGRLGIPFTRRPIGVDELRDADEVMLASTSICLLPVTGCDGRAIGPGAPGPMFQRLLWAWGELVGVDIVQQARQFASRESRAHG